MGDDVFDGNIGDGMGGENAAQLDSVHEAVCFARTSSAVLNGITRWMLILGRTADPKALFTW